MPIEEEIGAFILGYTGLALVSLACYVVWRWRKSRKNESEDGRLGYESLPSSFTAWNQTILIIAGVGLILLGVNFFQYAFSSYSAKQWQFWILLLFGGFWFYIGYVVTKFGMDVWKELQDFLSRRK